MSLLERAGRRFDSFMRGPERNPRVYGPLLPESIRYKLEYNGAWLGKQEIKSLATSHDLMLNSAFYLAMKALDGMQNEQLSMMNSMVSTMIELPESPQALRGVLIEEIGRIPEDSRVEGWKLERLSRQGFDTWDKLFSDTASDLAQNLKQPLLSAYATLTGLPRFVEAYRGTGIQINVLVPSMIYDKSDSNCGYLIDTQENGKVSFLPKDFDRSEDQVIVEETAHVFPKKTAHLVSFVKRNIATDQDIERVRILQVLPRFATV